MRAKTALAGSETRDMEREAKEPGRCSTRRRRLRSGWTQAGMREDCGVERAGAEVEGVIIGLAEEIGLAFMEGEGRGTALVMAAGDILGL